jgi:hypothetical protein
MIILCQVLHLLILFNYHEIESRRKLCRDLDLCPYLLGTFQLERQFGGLGLGDKGNGWWWCWEHLGWGGIVEGDGGERGCAVRVGLMI